MDSSIEEMRDSVSQGAELSPTPQRDARGELGDNIEAILPVFIQINMGRSGSKPPRTMSRGGEQRPTHRKRSFLLSALSRSALLFLPSLSKRQTGGKNIDILDAARVIAGCLHRFHTLSKAHSCLEHAFVLGGTEVMKVNLLEV